MVSEGADLAVVVRRSLEELGSGRGQTWVVACSGGPDSLALLVAAAEAARDLGARVVAVYVDHGLRPEAAGEGAFVGRTAAGLGAESRTVRVDVRARAAREHRSLMDAARVERHAALEAVADEVGATLILLGHTADDQVETVVMRLGRGTGVRGLRGMAPLAGRLVRPLLGVWRADIEAFLRARALTPVRDPSNEDRRFLRPLVRHEILPLLRERIPSVERDLLGLAAAARALTERIDAAADAAAASDAVGLDVDALRESPAEVRRARLERAYRHAGGGGLCGAHLRAVDRLLASTEGTHGIDLPGGIRAERAYRNLRFVRAGARAGQGGEIPVPGPGRYTFQGREFVIEPCTGGDQIGSNRDQDEEDDGCRDTCFDLDALAPPLVLRTPRPGDRIRPRGFGHRRKVSDLLGEARVPAPDRARWPLLADAREVLLVAGIRASETGRPGPGASRQVRVVVRKING
jgi:tRNA(Ile)-lysidine synthase